MPVPALNSILFTLGNRQQAANALPVARELAARGVACHLLSLDDFYGQGVDSILAAEPPVAGLGRSGLGVVALAPAFARRSMWARWRAMYSQAPQLHAAAGDHTALVVGVDGALERLLLAHYRRRHRFTAILWDSLASPKPRLRFVRQPRGQLWTARTWGRFHLRRAVLALARGLRCDPFVPGQAAHTPVQRIFVMGRVVARALADQGVPSRIEVTGLPRFAGLLAESPVAGAGEDRVLYLTSAFRWHDDRYLDACQQADLETLARRLPARGWSLTIRVHPREAPERYQRWSRLPGVTVSSGGSLREDAERAAVVVTSVSTAAAETLAMGVPAVLFLGALPRTLRWSALGSHPAMPVCDTVEELVRHLGSLRGTRPPRSLVDALFSPQTPTSAQRIADLLTAPSTPP